MKNRDKDAYLNSQYKTFGRNIFFPFLLKMKKLCLGKHNFFKIYPFWGRKNFIDLPYFFRYITSFTSFTVRGTSGNAAVTRLGA